MRQPRLARRQEWQSALVLTSGMVQAKVEANNISSNAAAKSCEKAQEWQVAVVLLSWVVQVKVEANTTSLNAAVSTGSSHWA